MYQRLVGEVPQGPAGGEIRSTSGIGGTSELFVSNPKRGFYGTAPQRLEDCAMRRVGYCSVLGLLLIPFLKRGCINIP